MLASGAPHSSDVMHTPNQKQRQQAETVKARYEAGLLAAFPFFTVCILVLIGDIVADPLARPTLTFALCLFIVCLPFVATLLISEIRFGRDAFTVAYYVRRSRVVRYDEVRDLDGNVIRTARATISLISMKNAGDVINALMPRLQEGQLSGDLLEAHSYIPATALVGFALWPALFFGLGALGLGGEWLLLATLLGWAAGFVLIYFAVRAYYRRKYA